MALQSDARIESYVPHRLEEGYGMNTAALDELSESGADLILTVDCGVTAVEEIQYGRSLGLEFIVTDHHRVVEGTELPDAIVVHPSLPGSAYPNPDLCGAGVAYKLAWHVATRWAGSDRVGKRMREVLLHMLPLAALGTLADVVPLRDENRIMARWGLRLIKASPIPGLQALIEAAGLAKADIDSESVGFRIGPLLNACGRMGHARAAVRLLTEAPEHEACSIAEELEAMNRRRRKMQEEIVEQAREMAIKKGMTGPDCRVIVLSHPEWHRGIVGIACSRLVDMFNRPVILLQEEDGLCRGSARSIESYSIHDALAENRRYLQTFGGHDAAAGLALAADQLQSFIEAMMSHANRCIEPRDLVPVLSIDCEVSLSEIDIAVAMQLKDLEPYGPTNRRPVFLIRGVDISGTPRTMGATGKHLSMYVRDGESLSGREMRAVWWHGARHIEMLTRARMVDLAGTIDINEWKGRRSVEIHLRDVHVVGEPGAPLPGKEAARGASP